MFDVMQNIQNKNGYDLKLLDISDNCYAHLINDTIYLYLNGEFSEMLYIDDIENSVDPIPLIKYEMELSSRASLYECVQLL